MLEIFASAGLANSFSATAFRCFDHHGEANPRGDLIVEQTLLSIETSEYRHAGTSNPRMGSFTHARS